MEKLGQVFTGLATSPVTSIDVEVHGELAQYDVSVLRLAALKGVFTDVVSDQVSYVNAPAESRSSGASRSGSSPTRTARVPNVLTIRGAQSDGPAISVSGTLTGPKQVEKLVEINGHDVEVALESHHVVMVYTDRPGIVAVYGKEFGDAGINIAAMQISRREAGGQALSVLTVDSPVPAEILEHVRSTIDAASLREIDITL